jgi:hypothetical protein
MFHPGFFKDVFHTYRPTLVTTEDGVQYFTNPAEPTSSYQGGRFFPKPGRFFLGARGVEQSFDATLLVPASYDLRPAQRQQQPDHVKIGDRWYVVLVVWDAANLGHYKKVLLEEKRA